MQKKRRCPYTCIEKVCKQITSSRPAQLQSALLFPVLTGVQSAVQTNNTSGYFPSAGLDSNCCWHYWLRCLKKRLPGPAGDGYLVHPIESVESQHTRHVFSKPHTVTRDCLALPSQQRKERVDKNAGPVHHAVCGAPAALCTSLQGICLRRVSEGIQKAAQ
jgi:hypothetical protein